MTCDNTLSYDTLSYIIHSSMLLERTPYDMIYVYMCICIYVYMYICIYVYMYKCIYVICCCEVDESECMVYTKGSVHVSPAARRTKKSPQSEKCLLSWRCCGEDEDEAPPRSQRFCMRYTYQGGLL